MKHTNPNNWVDQFEVVRNNQCIDVWLPPNGVEGERVIQDLHVDYIPTLISALKKFEQGEGR